MLNGLNQMWQSGSQKMGEFITAPVQKKSIREKHYAESYYISEYYCTISNIGILVVGLYYRDYSAVAAAIFSALSHAIPSQRLHDLDMLGIALVGINVATNYDVVLQRPDLLVWGAGAIAVNMLDTFITRNYLDEVGPWVHVIWHFAAGFALYKFNSVKANLPTHLNAMSSLSTLDKCKNYLPSYDTFQKITSSCSQYIPQALRGVM